MKSFTLGAALFTLCAAVFLCTAPGRILFPDDEIVFQTTRSIATRAALDIPGIPKRTGELEGRPSGTFGWAPGRGGKRYGFFGHGLSVVALPLYVVGAATAPRVPPTWRHAIRSDHYYVHPRGQREDWPRLWVSLTNCLVTAAAAWLMVLWARAEGFGDRVALGLGLIYAFGTSAWPYAGTFLSEPLSAATLIAAALGVARYRRAAARGDPDAARSLWVAAAMTAVSVHVHILNLIAVPCLLGYAAASGGPDERAHRKAMTVAMAIGAAGLALLGLDHALRFGSPFQTGRYDHYSHFVMPSDGLIAMIVAPGRSFWLYSPALVLGLWGWPPLRRRRPALAWFVAAMLASRLVFVAARSDWWGGWAIGPRFLVPMIPFALLPAAMVLRDLTRPARRWVVVAVLVVSVGLQAHLSAHSIMEWMFVVSNAGPIDGVGYLARSHWWPSASPIVGFFGLPVDMLSVGAVRLWHKGHPGMAIAFAVVGAVGVAAAWRLGMAVRRGSTRT